MSRINEFIVNKESATITIRREFDAKINKVWRAWADVEILDQWWAPSPWASKTKSMNFEIGGHRHYAMCGPEGEEHWSLTKYHNIVLHSLIVGEDYFSDSDAKINPDMPTAEFEQSFEETEEQTVVSIVTRYGDVSQIEAIISMGFKEGMTAILEQLDELLTKTK